MSERLRNLLSAAAGPEAKGDQGWHSAATQRLYFENPQDINSAGMVDVHAEAEGEPNTVRIELWVTPEVAAAIISHVTGRESITAHLLAKDEIRRAREAAEALQHGAEKVHGDGLDIPASALRLEREDDTRNESLTKAIEEDGGMGSADEDEEPDEEADQEIAALVAAQKADEATTEIEPIEAVA